MTSRFTGFVLAFTALGAGLLAVIALRPFEFGSAVAQGTADLPVQHFRERMSSFHTVYLPIFLESEGAVFSADGRSRRFDIGPELRFDGEKLWLMRGPVHGRAAGPEWDVFVDELWDELRAGLPGTDFVPLGAISDPDLTGRLGRGTYYRVEFPFDFPEEAPVDLLVGLAENGTPSGAALVAAGTLTLVSPEHQFWKNYGFDLREARWDVPLLPGLGTEFYNPPTPCVHGTGQTVDEFCRDPRNHQEYHAQFVRYEVEIDQALSSTDEEERGRYLRLACTGAPQTVSESFDMEFPVRSTDEGYGRMVAARAHCPVMLEVVSQVDHFPDIVKVKTTATGQFALVDTAVEPDEVLFVQPFAESFDGPGAKDADRTRHWEVPADRDLSGLTVRWSGQIAVNCKAGAAASDRPGISIRALKPMFEWKCLPDEPPPSD